MTPQTDDNLFLTEDLTPRKEKTNKLGLWQALVASQSQPICARYDLWNLLSLLLVEEYKQYASQNNAIT